MADQLNSLVPALIDFQYTICFYITNNSLTMASDGKCVVCAFLLLPFRTSQQCRPGTILAVADAKQCVERAWFRPVMAVLPAWLRFAQCLRRYRDTREANPHLANAVKYSTVFVVIIFTSLATHYEGIKEVTPLLFHIYFLNVEKRNYYFKCHFFWYYL